MCACGCPQVTFSLYLEIFGVLREEISIERHAKLVAILPDERVRYTLFYAMDHLGLTQHDGSICGGGRLTQTGRSVLAFLEKHGTDDDKWPPYVFYE